MHRHPFTLVLAFCCSTSSLAQPVPTSNRRDLADLLRTYGEDRSSIQSFYPRSWSETKRDRAARLFKEWQGTLAAVDFNALDQAGKIDYLLLKANLSYDLAQLDVRAKQLTEMEPLAPFRSAILALEEATNRMDPINPRAGADAVAALPDAINAARKRVEEGRRADDDKTRAADALKISPVLARRTAGLVDMLRSALSNWYEFHAGYHPEFTWWVRKPYEEASKSLSDYSEFLRRDVAGIKGEPDDPLIGDPIGREALLLDLENELMPYSPEELIAIGEREFAWCEAEMKKAANEMGFGDDWKKALAKVKEASVPPGEQDDLAAAQAREAIKFLKDRDLITIPPLCEETYRMQMITQDQQRTWPFAVYFGQAMGVGYPTDNAKHADKLMSMRGNNKHFNRIVTPHELIPGHHLQGFMAQRLRPERQMFTTPFFIEGWALYWEMTLWDKGWAQGPEDRVGMLFWRMHRCARIMVSLKFHLGELTPPQMIEYLVERVGHERFSATSEVRRFISGDYSPLYQCAYMIGGLQLRALRQEVVDAGAMPEKQFHDELLTYNSIPPELIRAGVRNLPLTPDWKPGWRFAGEPLVR